MDFAKELAYHTPENWVRDEETCSNHLKDESFWNSVIVHCLLILQLSLYVLFV